MLTVTNFYDFCLNENIDGLNEFKKTEFTLPLNMKKKILTDTINKGNLKKIK